MGCLQSGNARSGSQPPVKIGREHSCGIPAGGRVGPGDAATGGGAARRGRGSARGGRGRLKRAVKLVIRVVAASTEAVSQAIWEVLGVLQALGLRLVRVVGEVIEVEVAPAETGKVRHP